MAIYEATSRRKPGTRSNTKLIVSGGMSPAAQWIVDPTLPIQFWYDYGGPANKEVVVGKGMLVGVSPTRYMEDTIGMKRNALTLPTGSVRPFGMAPYNFTKHWEDFNDGNQPSVITRDYIELPWIPNAADAAGVKYGAVHGDIKPNDLVTWSRDPQNYGKMIKWVEGTHSIADIVGQVGELDDDQTPYGWLQWVMWDEQARREDQDGPINKSGYSAPDNDGGYPYDPEYKRLGKNGENGYFSQWETTPADAAGIPGLTDGRQKAQTVQTRNFTIPAGTAAGAKIQFQLGLKNIINGSLHLFIDSVETFANFTVDFSNGVVNYTLPALAIAAQTVQVQFRSEFFGTPAGWDHKGNAGAVHVLLKF